MKYEMPIYTVPVYQKRLQEAKDQIIGLNPQDHYDERQELKMEIAICEERIEKLKRKAVNIWERSNIGEYFKECTFESYDDKNDFWAYKRGCERYAREFVNNEGQGIVLYGSNGVGKTHLATAIGNYLVYELGISCYFAPVSTLIRDIQKRFNKKNADEKDDPERLCKTVDLLILDDLGREKQSEWSQQILFDIIDARYRAKKPIIITTNLNPEGYSFQDAIGDAAASRMVNISEFYGMNGEDYRVKHPLGQKGE